MSEAKKPLGTINLSEEIENRKRLSETFDRILNQFCGLSVNTPEDLDTVALLLCEVREQKKILEKQEEQLKAEVKRFFTEGSEVLDLPSVLVILDRSERRSVDSVKLIQEMGSHFVERFQKVTPVEKLLLKRK